MKYAEWILGLALSLQDPRLPRPDHVVVVVMENQPFSAIIGSGDAPYINQIAQEGALFTNSFAITHPSQPNYLALFSGWTRQATDDRLPPPGAPYSAPNLASELLAAGAEFRGYSDDLPYADFPGPAAGGYRRHRAPWTFFPNVRPLSHEPFNVFLRTDFDLLPAVSFVIPRLEDSMFYDEIRRGDDWLRENLDPYIQWAKTHNSLFILTFDEDDQSENNRITTIFVGEEVMPGAYSREINHYTVLRTIEDMYGTALTDNAAGEEPITEIWTPQVPQPAQSAPPEPPTPGSDGDCGLLGAEALLLLALLRRRATSCRGP